MTSNELRTKYIEFFTANGHLLLPSAPLVPIDCLGVEDRSTLFTSAGMQQFKPYFIGAAKPPSGRIVTIQKCVRTGDIDSVGDYSHCTFFEMLGNFSFGDYFKAEVIPWTWEFLTQWLKLDPDRLCVTVFEEDDEAAEIWRTSVGLPPDRIHRLGEDKNYWPANAISAGPNGPCGPCTEVFYRVAPESEMTNDPSLTPTQRFKLDDDAGRWLEIWNNVFTQFDRQERDGTPVLVPLPARNNDTGAGFERIAQVLQGVGSVFETDLFRPILSRIESLCGAKYLGQPGGRDFAFRVVAEHARSTAFCVADGILPSNEGRGYVLRRIMRRAVRFGKTSLGFEAPFLHEVVDSVIETMGATYPELSERREHILQTARSEEERFRRTLDNGNLKLLELLGRVEPSKGIAGEDAFTLYDTYGFPLELTREIAAERGIAVDEEGFQAALEQQRERSREAGGMDREVFRSLGEAVVELQTTLAPSEFVGYERLSVEQAQVLAIIASGELVDFVRTGQEADVVLDVTPFYAESGGQVGDTGTLRGPQGLCAVKDTRRLSSLILHHVLVAEGSLAVGETVEARVDAERRFDIMRNHTATHLLHAALREVLGSHVHQKGSLVAPDRLRFDFTHGKPMTAEEISRVEELVNERILRDLPVVVHSRLPISEARARGAMALFGEKYGDYVRMVEVEGVSRELCGGTHLKHTSQAGIFKIVSETGIAAGVRRIEAVTGAGALLHLSRLAETLDAAAGILKTGPRDVVAAVERLASERARLEKELQEWKARAAAGSSGADLAEHRVHDVCVVTGSLAAADAETLAAIADREARSRGSAVIVLGTEHEGKALFVAKVTPDLVSQGYHAGNLVREVARVAGGGGGGRADFAQAGARDAARLQEALAKALEVVAEQQAVRR